NESARILDFKAMLSSIQSQQREREEEVAQTLERFAKEMHEMANQLEELLSESESTRMASFKQMLSDIQSRQGERKNEVGQTLDRFDKELKEMADQLKGFLSESESTRMASFEKMLSNIQSRQSRRAKKVAALIKKFDDELHEMASQLKEFLSDSEGTRLEEFKGMLSSIKSRQRAREEETARLISEYRNDIKEAHSHWQNLAKIMTSKRTGKRVPITEVPKEAEVPKEVEKEAERAFSEGEVMERVRAIIFERSGGISLKRLAKKLRMPHIRLARPISELVEEGRVVKRDSHYYPAEAGSEE
ncbi:hypothetical protein KKB40_06480, partial [Patescibacteria group bacterium]|nr:hypothetical protein [Patescibacteria group bacterium]